MVIGKSTDDRTGIEQQSAISPSGCNPVSAVAAVTEYMLQHTCPGPPSQEEACPPAGPLWPFKKGQVETQIQSGRPQTTYAAEWEGWLAFTATVRA